MVRQFISGLLVVTSALILAACGADGGKGEAAKVNSSGCSERPVSLAVPAQSINYLPFYYGKDHGIYQRHCLDLDIQILRGDAALAGVIRGDLDLTAAGGTAMRAAAQGAPVRAVMITVDKYTSSLVAKQDVTALEALRGRNIATLGTGDSLSTALFSQLRAHPLDPERALNILTVNATSDAYSSLVGGGVDAAVLTPPYDVQAERDGFRPLIDFGKVTEGSQAQVATSVEKISSERDLLRDFIAATRESIATIRGGNDGTEPTDAVVQYVANFYKLDPTIARESLKVALPAFSRDGTASDGALLSQLDPGSSPDQLRQVVDFSILKEVGQ